jgi:apolipoprotein N-acyltransferase
VVSVIANLTHPADPRPPADWLAIDTHFGSIAHRTPGPLAEYRAAEAIQQRALSAQAPVIVFPETVVPYWTASTDEFWQPTLAALRVSGKTILIGARIPRSSIAPGPYYDFSTELAALRDTVVRALTIGSVDKSSWSPAYFNGIVIRGAEFGTFMQRIPVPIAMWNPLRPASAPMNVAGPGVLPISGERAAILICYEQLILWPVVTSMLQNPTVLIAVANDYWAAGTPLMRFQAAAVRSWARLFGIPYLAAVNT